MRYRITFERWISTRRPRQGKWGFFFQRQRKRQRRTLPVAKIHIQQLRIVLLDKRVRARRVPHLEPPLGSGMESRAALVSLAPGVLHLEVAETRLVDNARDDLRRVRRRYEVHEVPTIAGAKHGSGEEREREVGV